jgi:hypothetical protein
MRGVIQLPNGRYAGRRAQARTVRRDFILQPGHDERPVIVYNDPWEKLQIVGHDRPEGHDRLVAILRRVPDAE